MAGSRNVLGRGLGSLIPQQEARPQYFQCAIDQIRPMREQPRQVFEDDRLDELAASIKQSGILQPALVRRDGNGYVLIAGERRWRAARRAGLTEIPVVVRDVTDDNVFTLALIENLQRQDLNDLEKAEACQRLIDEQGLTQQQVAEAIGLSRSAVANMLRLQTLGDTAKDALVAEQISAGHARQMVGLDEVEQAEVLDEIVDEGLSVRETEARVRERKQRPKTKRKSRKPAPRQVSAEVRQVEEQLTVALGSRVRIADKGDGSGEVRIEFASYDVLEGILERILEGPG